MPLFSAWVTLHPLRLGWGALILRLSAFHSLYWPVLFCPWSYQYNNSAVFHHYCLFLSHYLGCFLLPLPHSFIKVELKVKIVYFESVQCDDWIYVYIVKYIDSTDMNLSKLWEIPKDREAWPAAVCLAKCQTRLSDWTTAVKWFPKSMYLPYPSPRLFFLVWWEHLRSFSKCPVHSISFCQLLCTCFWLCRVSTAAHRLSLVAVSRGFSSPRCTGLSLRWLLFLRSTGPRCRASLLWCAGLVAAHEFSCPAWCGIFPDQGLNLCPLHWQADS